MAEVRDRKGILKNKNGSVNVPPGKALTDMGRMEVVQIDDLEVDHSYQRDLKQGLIQKIGEAWDDPAAGPILVSRRKDGSMWIINGQHRAAAAKMFGKTELVAQVMDDLTRAEEADLRLKCNTRASDSSLETFRAQVTAGNKEALDIKRICASYDTQINRTPDMKQGINCVAAVRAVYRIDKGTLLVRVFDVIQRGWGTVGGEYTSTNTIKSLAWFMQKHGGEFDITRLVERLKVTGVETMTARMHAHKAIQSGANWLNFYRALVETYNDKLGQAARLEVRTGNWSAGTKEPRWEPGAVVAGY